MVTTQPFQLGVGGKMGDSGPASGSALASPTRLDHAGEDVGDGRVSHSEVTGRPVGSDFLLRFQMGSHPLTKGIGIQWLAVLGTCRQGPTKLGFHHQPQLLSCLLCLQQWLDGSFGIQWFDGDGVVIRGHHSEQMGIERDADPQHSNDFQAHATATPWGACSRRHDRYRSPRKPAWAPCDGAPLPR